MKCLINVNFTLQQGRSELEETLKRLQQHKGVTGVIVVNGEILYTALSDKNIEVYIIQV